MKFELKSLRWLAQKFEDRRLKAFKKGKSAQSGRTPEQYRDRILGDAKGQWTYKGKKYKAELRELQEAITNWEKEKTLKNEMCVLAEIGDLLFHSHLISIGVLKDPDFTILYDQIFDILQQYEKKGWDLTIAETAAEIKYSLRYYKAELGELHPKDADLEESFLLSYLFSPPPKSIET